MKIALDYDGTYTLDEPFWIDFIRLCKGRNHDIRIVTMRDDNQANQELVVYFARFGVPVIFTSKKQKREHCNEIDWQPQIWIDDSPEFIVRPDVFKFFEVMKGSDEEGDKKP